MKNRHVWLLMLLLTVTIGIKAARLQAQETAPCSSSLTPSLEIHQWGKTTPGEPNNVRRQPNLYSEIVGQLPAETFFRVLAGPHCADGITWWQVETEGSTLRGWMAEGMNGENFLESLDAASSASYRELLRMGRGTIKTIAWRPDGKALLVAGSRGIAYYTDELDLIGYWDKLYGNEEILSIAWHPDGRQFVTGGDSFSWDWQNGLLRV
ncbi:MAG TPA: SH3 domain-containing protein, partial [Phototrophicaceae bacterium]|nr:SH3 domain-containing protein [Phototrophicaceae bacterium]